MTDGKGTIWFTVQGGQRIGRLDTKTGAITEYKTRGNPYGIALDRAGNVWFCQFGGDRLGRLDPATGGITEMTMEPGSRPRRMAAAPDGSLWVTLYGNGKLVRVDPAAQRVVKEYALPGGPTGGPYAVSVDAAGIVWANEIQTDTVVRLDPQTGDVRVVTLPSKNVGIRKMIVDADGRLWYMAATTAGWASSSDRRSRPRATPGRDAPGAAGAGRGQRGVVGPAEARRAGRGPASHWYDAGRR
ncbi:MAG: virginiamycin B lyase family protein [Candidatus Rokuibacteriota bacterium]